MTTHANAFTNVMVTTDNAAQKGKMKANLKKEGNRGLFACCACKGVDTGLCIWGLSTSNFLWPLKCCQSYIWNIGDKRGFSFVCCFFFLLCSVTCLKMTVSLWWKSLRGSSHWRRFNLFNPSLDNPGPLHSSINLIAWRENERSTSPCSEQNTITVNRWVAIMPSISSVGLLSLHLASPLPAYKAISSRIGSWSLTFI